MKNKTLLPITLVLLLGITACGGQPKKSSQDVPSSVPADTSEVAPSSQEESKPAPSSEEKPSSQTPSSSAEPASSSQQQSSASTPASSSTQPSSSEAPIEYGVSIKNKADFADWHAGDNDITLSIELSPAANVALAINEGDLVITSSDPTKVSVSGLRCSAKDAGQVRITATYHGKSDYVDIDVKAEDIKTIADIIATGKKDDKITFKGYYIGRSTRINYLGSETYPYVYVADGQQAIILYCMSRTFLEGIEVGDLVKVSGTYSPYNGLPETASGSVTVFEKSTSSTVVRPQTVTIDADHPSFTMSMDNIGSRVHVEGAEVTNVVAPVMKTRTDLEPAVDGQAVTTTYYERTFKIKVGTNEYELFINERYVTPETSFAELSVGDHVSFDAFVNIPSANKFNFAMPNNLVRVASEKDPVESIALDAGSAKVYVGKTMNVTATVLPATALQTVTWASSDATVATVENGVVTGVKAGTATITATTVGLPTKSASVDITVYNQITDPVHAGTVDDPYDVDDAVAFTNKLANKAFSDHEIYVEGKVCESSYSTSYGNFTIWLEDAIGGKAFELYATVLDSDEFSSSLQEFYQGTHTDANGNTVGNLVGKTVRAHGYAQKYNTTLELSSYTPSGATDKIYPTIYYVSKSEATSLSLPATASLAVGGEQVLELTAEPIDANLKYVQWSSSVEAVARVDSNGKVTGVSAGESIITAQLSETVKATCTVTVVAGGIPATSVTLNKTSGSLYIGQSEQLVATVLPEDTTDTLEWSSSDATVASVDNTGKVTALKAGEATITATAGEVSAEFALTVAQAALANYNNAKKGDKVDFYAYYVGKYNKASKGYFVADGVTGAYVYAAAPSGVNAGDIVHIAGEIDVYSGLREVINVTATKVDAHEGLVAPVTLELTEAVLGSLTVADQGRKATISGQVTAISANPTYGSTSPVYTIKVGTKTIGVQLHKSNITEAEYNDFASKAQLNKNVTIEAYVGAYKKDLTDLTQLAAADYQLVNPKVTAVVEEELTGIAFNQESVTVAVGENVTLAVSPVPAAADLGTVSFSSSDDTVATVDQTGKVTGVAIGNATITATAGEFTATCPVTVVAAPATTTITLTDANVLGYAGTNVTYPTTADPVTATVDGMGVAAVGCGAYGDGIQMRTKNSITSAIYNTTEVDINKLQFVWAASKTVTADKEFHLYVEFSNSADFSTLVGSKTKVHVDETTKLAELAPSAAAKYFRVSHGNQGAVYLDAIKVVINSAQEPESTPLPLAGDKVTKIEGAGFWIYLDNTDLGITGANAADILATAEITITLEEGNTPEEAQAAVTGFLGSAAKTQAETLGDVLQFDSYEGNSVRLFFTAQAGVDASWQMKHTVSIAFTVGEVTYASTLVFIGGVLQD